MALLARPVLAASPPLLTTAVQLVPLRGTREDVGSTPVPKAAAVAISPQGRLLDRKVVAQAGGPPRGQKAVLTPIVADAFRATVVPSLVAVAGGATP